MRQCRQCKCFIEKEKKLIENADITLRNEFETILHPC